MVEQVQDDFFGLSIGERLQKARKAKKKEITQVADDLCINQAYIQHLEEDKFDKMPAAYIIGFLRSYSDYLSLDTEEIIAEVKSRSELVQDEHYKAILPQTEGKMPQKKTVFPLIAAVAVAVLSVTAVLVSQKDSALEIKTTEEVAEVVEPKNEIPKEVKKDVVKEKTKAKEKVAEVKKEKPAKKVSEAVVTESGIKLPPVEVVVEGPKFVNEKPHGARLFLEAKDKDVWFQIKHLKRNRVYVSRTLKAGEAYWVKSWRGVYIDAGLPQKLEVTIDGVAKGPIGASGRRLRDLSLNPEFLTRMYFDKGINSDKSKKLPQTKEQISVYKMRAAEAALKAKEEAEKPAEETTSDTSKVEEAQ